MKFKVALFTLQKHLQSVHQWYRNEESLASHGSFLRQLVSVACAEALPLLIAKEECELLFMLTLQLMFCQEAGFFSQSREVFGSAFLVLVLANLLGTCMVMYMLFDGLLRHYSVLQSYGACGGGAYLYLEYLICVIHA